MAGHSHWARIKRAKAVTDARRGRSWSKLSRAIMVAARQGGGDPDANISLRYAIDAAKAENMPKDTIERAIKKATGELGTTSFEELVYEGYGPGGAAVICTGLTDNRNRTAGEIRKIFELNGGNLSASNSVAYMFAKRGVFSVPKTAASEEALTNLALEAGADDVQDDGDAWELTCEPGAFETVRKALESAKIAPERSEIALIAANPVNISGDVARKMLSLVDALEDHDDIQKVYSNFEVSEEEMERLTG